MFISFEGIEGCGKTTQVRLLASALQARGIPITSTREPGGSPVGPAIRSLLLSEAHSLDPVAELLLYAAERAEHVSCVIRPALASGRWVLCDRYGDATRAYQAFGRGLPREHVETLHAIATGGLEPDLTIYLRLPVASSIARARDRNTVATPGEGRFEAEPIAFHERVAAGYEALAREFPERIVPVDAAGGEKEIAARILSILEARVGV